MSESKTPWEQSAEWFARTLAIVLVMVAPGALGAWVDGRLGTNFVAAIGFVFGMSLAIGMLILFTRIKPIDNDGEIMKGRSTYPTTPHSTASRPPQTSSQSTAHKPSESRLPEVPGAEVLEPPRDE